MPDDDMAAQQQVQTRERTQQQSQLEDGSGTVNGEERSRDRNERGKARKG